MKGLNKVLLIGRLGRDPELRATQSGQSVAKFSLATDETWTKDGEKQQRTEWHNVVIWGKLAEIANQYLKKGRLVYVEGKIQSREYETDGGEKRRVYDIVASDFSILDSNGDARGEERRGPGSGRGSGRYEAADDDVPF